jgi:Mg2+/Co2+ transporter CorC
MAAKTQKTEKKPVQFLDLDAVSMPTEVVVKLDGKEHKLQELTVQDFIENTKDQAKLGETSTVEEQMDVMIAMIHRAFPTISEDQLRKLGLTKMTSLLNFALQNNGDADARDEAEQTAKESESPLTAG